MRRLREDDGRLDIVVGLLMVAGLVGSVVPCCRAPAIFAEPCSMRSPRTSVARLRPPRILALLAVAASVLEHLAGALGARTFGGGRGAVLGAVIGVVVGLAWPPFGLLICPIAGAIIGELIRARALRPSVRTGVGVALGMIAGVASLALSVVWWPS